jgi:hypothetical protein
MPSRATTVHFFLIGSVGVGKSAIIQQVRGLITYPAVTKLSRFEEVIFLLSTTLLNTLHQTLRQVCLVTV